MPDVEDDAHGRREGRCGYAGEPQNLLPRRPKASGPKLNGLNAWCKVTVLRLISCGLGEGGGRARAAALRLSTTVASLNLSDNGLGGGGERALAEALSLVGFRIMGGWVGGVIGGVMGLRVGFIN